jgi:hypothetical protein
MSKTFSNTPYNVKSMNGIITLSDGAGTTIENATIENGQITTNDINSSGKITAIEIEATSVLFNDNLDMNNNDIINVNNINTTLINGGAYPPSTADTLSAILANGNSAGANDINMNSQNITNVNNIALTTINGSAYPPPSSVDNLADTLLQGNSAGATSINMNSQDVQNVDELQVDNITGRNGVANDIRLNSDINVNGNDFQNCNFINFSAITAGIYNPNTIQLQAGTGATSGDFNVVLGHSTSQMNITGGDLDMNNNDIINVNNIALTTINGNTPAVQLPRFYWSGNPVLATVNSGSEDIRDTLRGTEYNTGNPFTVVRKFGVFTDTAGNTTNTIKMAFIAGTGTSSTRKIGIFLPSGTYKWEFFVSNVDYFNAPSDVYTCFLDEDMNNVYKNGNTRCSIRILRNDSNGTAMNSIACTQIIVVPDGDAVCWLIDAGSVFNPTNIFIENFHCGFEMLEQGNWNGNYASLNSPYTDTVDR